jgi:hypothetical protein
MWVKEKIVLERMLLDNILLHVQGLNCEKCVYELEDNVEQKALNLNLMSKLRLTKKILLVGFLNYLLEHI